MKRIIPKVVVALFVLGATSGRAQTATSLLSHFEEFWNIREEGQTKDVPASDRHRPVFLMISILITSDSSPSSRNLKIHSFAVSSLHRPFGSL